MKLTLLFFIFLAAFAQDLYEADLAEIINMLHTAQSVEFGQRKVNLEHTLRVKNPHVTLDPNPLTSESGDVLQLTANGRPIYKPAEDVFVEFEIKNPTKKAVRFDRRDTPLDKHWGADFFWGLSDVIYTGEDIETRGEYMDPIILQPGAKETIMVNIRDYVAFTDSPIVKLKMSYRIVFAKDHESDTSPALEEMLVKTNTVNLFLTRMDHENEPELGAFNYNSSAGRNEQWARWFTDVTELKKITEIDGIPTWTVNGCTDSPQLIPQRVLKKINNKIDCGEKGCTSCKKLVSHFGCSGRGVGHLTPYCPNECGVCDKYKKMWSNPMLDRTYKTKHCNADQKEFLKESFLVQKRQCRDILWQLKNFEQNFNDYNNEMVRGLIKKVFGRIEASDVAMLYEGFVRICSADDFGVNCDPRSNSGGCSCSGLRYSDGGFNGQQRDILKDPKFNFTKMRKECLSPIYFENEYREPTQGACVDNWGNKLDFIDPVTGLDDPTKFKKAEGSETWDKAECLSWCKERNWDPYLHWLEDPRMFWNMSTSFNWYRDPRMCWLDNGVGCFKHRYGGTVKGDGTPGSWCWYYTSTGRRNGCKGGGAIAYVQPRNILPKEINVCPIHFFAAPLEIGHFRKLSAPSVFVHELSHFIDVTGTSDSSVSLGEIEKQVRNQPGSWNHNAGSWHFFFDNKMPSVEWNCFAEPDGPSCTGATKPGVKASSMVTPAPDKYPWTNVPTTAPPTSGPTAAPTTSEPTPAPTTSEPTPAPTTSEPTPAPTTEPTTPEPTTSAPTTSAPTTSAPTTLEPTSLAPTERDPNCYDEVSGCNVNWRDTVYCTPQYYGRYCRLSCGICIPWPEKIKSEDCIGTWSDCTSSCETVEQKTFTKIQDQLGLGAACPSATDCTKDEGDCKVESPSEHNTKVWAKLFGEDKGTNPGSCEIDGNCISSRNYPEEYGDNNKCRITFQGDALLEFEKKFALERTWDLLRFDGVPLEDLPAFGLKEVNRGTVMQFTSDYSVSKAGFKFCVSALVDRDCIGFWSACTSSCEAADQRTFTKMQAQAGNGAACPTATDCEKDDGDCQETEETALLSFLLQALLED